jgi:hypothetical protein
MEDLSNKVYYTNPDINYIVGEYVTEYDISKAGPSALLQSGCIDQKTFDFLLSLSRESRQIKTGLLIRDNPEFEAKRKRAIADARNSFMQINELSEDNIVSIKNDAIFVTGAQPKYLDFNMMHFVPKHSYTSYYNVNKTEIYYYFNQVTNEEHCDIKGISDSVIPLLDKGILDFLKFLFQLAQTGRVANVIPVIQEFNDRYIRRELDLEYYREFNSACSFKLNTISDYSVYRADMLPLEINKNDLDISYNLNIIRQFYKIYSKMYFDGIK